MGACSCAEKNRPISLPPGSNERPRQWFVLERNVSRSAFNGYMPTWSEFSNVQCRVCRAYWRTKAAFVSELTSCEFWPHETAPSVAPWET